MIWLYRLLFVPLLVLMLPYYLRRMWKRGGYSKDFQHRFGLYRNIPPARPGRARLWIQAVSVGEVQALGPLLESLRQTNQVDVFLTTTTSTGYALVRERYRDLTAYRGVFPLDFLPFSHKAWNRLAPDAVVLMEGELWPEHLHQANKRNVPVLLINARLSDRSFRRYRRFAPLAKRLLGQLDTLLAGSKDDAERFRQLAPNHPGIRTSGNLKCDIRVPAAPTAEERRAKQEELGFAGRQPPSPEPIILLGSSTWPDEEEQLLRIFEQARKNGIPLRLLLVPRHAERREELVRLLKTQSRSWWQRSQPAKPIEPVEIVLADTTGELTDLTRFADLVFIGKSLPPNDGGQTPIEAAALGKTTVYGPAMSNFRAICRTLENAHGAIRCQDANHLQETLLHLLQNPDERRKLATNAQSWHQSNCGAVAATHDVILQTLHSETPPNPPEVK